MQICGAALNHFGTRKPHLLSSLVFAIFEFLDGCCMSKFDKCSEELTFHDLREPVEDVQGYRLGGCHPLCLGDHFQNGRYQILRKLGYGGYPTVWLAKDKVLVTACLPT